MRQQFYTNYIDLDLENILWKCRSINKWLIKGRCKISSVNALIWRFFFEILSFPVFKNSGNGSSILFLVAILQELKNLEYYSRPNSNLSSIPNINYLAPLFMHCYSCSKITILVLLSPRHLKWHIWLRVRGCAYVWLLQIYTRL